MEIAGIKIDDQVDITDKVCPLTFVKAKVALDELEDGEVIAIRMNDGEPVQNVPRSIKEEGHKIVKQILMIRCSEAHFRFWLIFIQTVVCHARECLL